MVYPYKGMYYRYSCVYLEQSTISLLLVTRPFSRHREYGQVEAVVRNSYSAHDGSRNLSAFDLLKAAGCRSNICLTCTVGVRLKQLFGVE